VAVPEVVRRATPSPGSSGQACSATVDGTDAAAVEAAVAAAGSGTVCFPAGRYEGPFAASVAGQTWRLADGATLALITHDPQIAGGFPRQLQMRDGEIVGDVRR